MSWNGKLKTVTFSKRLGLGSRRKQLGIALLAGLIWGGPCLVFSSDHPEPHEIAPDTHMREGAAMFKQGRLKEATHHWTQAAEHYANNGENRKQVQALTALGQALPYIDDTHQALERLQQARKLAESIPAPELLPAILGNEGRLWHLKGHFHHALKVLNEALEMAKSQGNVALTAGLLNETGNTLFTLDQFDQAVRAYAESARLAQQTGQTDLSIRSRLNTANANIEQGLYVQALPQLETLAATLSEKPNSSEKITGLLKVGLAFKTLRERWKPGTDRRQARRSPGGDYPLSGTRGVMPRPIDRPAHTPEPSPSHPPTPPTSAVPTDRDPLANQLVKKSAQAFHTAGTVSQDLKDRRSESYAWGYLGGLYEHTQQIEEALRLTRQAIHAAQQAQAPDSLYRWQWQTARLHRSAGRLEEATQAYRQALATVQPIRGEIVRQLPISRQSFHDKIGGLYSELVDLMLMQAGRSGTPQEMQEPLQEIQKTLEQLKAAELQDYFQDQCVDMATTHGLALDRIPKQTAIFYPILLSDRLELLVRFQAGLQRWTTPISEEKLNQTIVQFRHSLQNPHSRDLLPQAQRLYDWLIRPIQAALQAHDIQTIVFVPDGALRSIPLAALHDGQGFLIAKFATTTTPGMTLTQAQPFANDHPTLLAVGLTEATQNFPPLPHVREEVSALRTLYEGTTLLDQDFTLRNLEHELQNRRYHFIHIASHGRVEKNVNETFVLAYDERLTMDRLTDLIGTVTFGQGPLNLLTLSACQTAIGDDRAALGLAGMAVKAGVQSALASLWFIDDAATAKLVTEFYQHLSTHPDQSKAEALRQAQLTLLQTEKFAHPSQWAAMLLIGNWL